MKYRHSVVIAGRFILIGCEGDVGNPDEPLTGMKVSELVVNLLACSPEGSEVKELVSELEASLRLANDYLTK